MLFDSHIVSEHIKPLRLSDLFVRAVLLQLCMESVKFFINYGNARLILILNFSTSVFRIDCQVTIEVAIPCSAF